LPVVDGADFTRFWMRRAIAKSRAHPPRLSGEPLPGPRM